ncbi:MAG: hypothetical protein JSV39_00060, partial [Candidatus Aenigmatarchaeota archaeon]
MKGFMHVVEILLVVLLVFFVFTQFASIPSISDDWSRTKLSLIGSDVLRALERRGVDWFDKAELEYELNRTIPENVIYSVLLENVIKPEIVVGCLCDDGEMAKVEEMLGGFVVNGVGVDFEIIQVTDASEAFSLDFDVALIYGYEDFSVNPYHLRNFLAYDRGVIEICDNPVIDSTQRDIFGLDYGEIKSGSYNITFSDSSMENGKEVNRIYDYFSHIPVFYDSFESLGLAQWLFDDAGFALGTGNPEPSVELMGDDCVSGNGLIYTKDYESFRGGEIDFDVNLAEDAVLFVGFGDYLASLSTDVSMGYDSFYNPSMNPVGWNSSHITNYGEWIHVKVVVKKGDLKLYNNGEEVANASVFLTSDSNISFFNLCGEAYVDNVRVTYEEKHDFDNENENFLDDENTTQADDNLDKILLKQRGTNVPACIINYNMQLLLNGKDVWRGRAAWLSNNTDYDSEDYGTLLKSLAAWAAGDEYSMIKS